MSYELDFTIASGTPSGSPHEETLMIAPGTVTDVWITFPDGCADLAHVRFLYHTQQIWPYTRGAWFRGNGRTVHIRPNADLDEVPHELQIQGYNEDALYQHSVTIEVDMDFKGDWLSALRRFFVPEPAEEEGG